MPDGPPLRFPPPRRAVPSTPYRDRTEPDTPTERRRLEVHRPEPPAMRWTAADHPPEPRLVEGLFTRVARTLGAFVGQHPLAVLYVIAAVGLAALVRFAQAFVGYR